MPKRRTKLAIDNQPHMEKGIVYSQFLITINANKSFVSKKSIGFNEMIDKLSVLGDFLMKKSNLLRFMKFKDGSSLKNNMHLIRDIDPDRQSVVEWGKQHHFLHLHSTFWITHKTSVLLDREKILKVAAEILDQPKSTIHLNIRGAGMSFKDYTEKGLPKGNAVNLKK